VITPDPRDLLPQAPRDPGLEARAAAAWDVMAKDPEHESFGGPTWAEMPPWVRRFAVLAFAIVEQTEAVERAAGGPRAFIRCWACKDSGLVHRELGGNPVAWYCLACDAGLRMCADFWQGKNQTPGGQREFKAWSQANPIDARRVGAVMAEQT
jgi:hypothetical protein